MWYGGLKKIVVVNYYIIIFDVGYNKNEQERAEVKKLNWENEEPF